MFIVLNTEDERRNSEVHSDSHVGAVHWEFITVMRTARQPHSLGLRPLSAVEKPPLHA